MLFEVYLSIEEMAAFLRSFGLTVERRNVPVFFSTHGSGGYAEEVPVLVVVNPYRPDKHETVEIFMKKFMKKKAKELFLQADKIEIFTLFEN